MLRVAHRALELLEYICESPGKEFSVTELGQRFKVNKTSVFRTLRVMTERGYLRQDKKPGLYRLDFKILEFGRPGVSQGGPAGRGFPLYGAAVR